ncbi:hypothetical protein CYLTODRAFT_422076 [Cylindrobasidium torrendii FP15055 ss-10]|uniref:ferric-chelate reductase (NADPH) n=1 Tax=Cylindrobasidium torrendii FP15055 ss-10 TaxID=1314674 RepID=A0A0D7BED0_9AGAR|nr:hypothetical protein CYLTODRAFT_422076 [Cylindrobasidium torrendii FP15055 ss-10]
MSAANITVSTGNDTMSGSAPASADAATNAPPAGPAGPQVNEMELVYHISLLILALIALLFVFRIPSMVARFTRSTEWTKGHIFSSSARDSSPHIVHVTREKEGMGMGSSDDSHTYYNHGSQPQRIDGKGLPTEQNPPPHVSMCPAFLRGFAAELRTRVLPGYSVNQVICVLVYLASWIYPTFYKCNPLSEPVRTGWIGVAQLPFIFAFASKNNVIGPFLGMGYEKLNFMHRAAGLIMVVAINVHGMGYIMKWVIKGTFQESIADPSMYWGLIGLISCDILYFFSTEGWRNRAYNIFFASHVGGFSLLLAGTWQHFEVTHPWVWAAIGLYSFDSLCRWIKTRIHTAVIRPIPELGMTRIEIPQITGGWRAGQHVRIRVISSGMGVYGWAETHPFTIASAPGPEGMIVMVKKVGTWSTNLFNMAKFGNGEAGVGRNVTVMVEGPYGGPGVTLPSSHSAAVFVVGGSGITYALAGINELIQKDLRGESRTKIIELVWTVQDPSSLVPLVPQFSAMIQSSVFTPVRISVFYTRAVTGKFPFAKDFFHPRLSLAPGRPKLASILEATISKTTTGTSAGTRSGMMVAVCGPAALADDVVNQVGKIDPTRRDEVGGIEIVEDVFGW